MLITAKTENVMGSPEQVFLYISRRCNARCNNCYACPLPACHIGADIPLEDAASILTHYRALGASKATFLGGEPTMHNQLPDMIVLAKMCGYDLVRINTNGML